MQGITDRLNSADRRWLPSLANSLLAALLVHLLFMVTPAHAEMVLQGFEAPPHQAASEAFELEIPHGSHCAVEWTAPARPLEPCLSLTSTPTSFGLPSVGSTACCSDSQASGHPRAADPQAVLQVFRI
jgi:hypothetical protein